MWASSGIGLTSSQVWPGLDWPAWIPFPGSADQNFSAPGGTELPGAGVMHVVCPGAGWVGSAVVRVGGEEGVQSEVPVRAQL